MFAEATAVGRDAWRSATEVSARFADADGNFSATTLLDLTDAAARHDLKKSAHRGLDPGRGSCERLADGADGMPLDGNDSDDDCDDDGDGDSINVCSDTVVTIPDFPVTQRDHPAISTPRFLFW